MMRWAWLGLVALGAVACGPSNNVKAGSHLDTDAQAVAAMVTTVQGGITQYAASPTEANGVVLAEAAQTAHDDIDGYRHQILVDSTGSKGADLEVAANDLKNAMGALVAFAGDPNPATLASLTSQFDRGVGEWNAAIAELYAGVKSSESPPTISCAAC